MNLPWISRAHHLKVVEILQNTLEDCRTQRENADARAALERERADKYVEKMLAMRLENGGEPVYPDVEPVKDPLEGGIRSAINEMDVDEQAYLEEYAQNQIELGANPENIIKTINAGLEFQP